MTSRLAIAVLLVSMLMNNVALAGVLWLDQNRAAAGMVEHSELHAADRQDDGGEHEHHATHCCHLQAHFQTVLADNSLVHAPVLHERWLPRSTVQPDSPTDAPPTPPPKAA